MSFQIIRDDITKVKADAIVNTANPKPIYAGGVDYAIYQAAGAEKLLEARQIIGDIAGGEVESTGAYGLNARFILHTVGPIWNGGGDGEFEILRSCYEKCLKKARELGCLSIAFPLIATGVNGFPKDKALQIALSVIQPWVMENDMDVTLVVFNRDAYVLSGKLVENVRAYVDANYVDEALEDEYAIDQMEAAFGGSRREFEEERRLLAARRAERPGHKAAAPRPRRERKEAEPEECFADRVFGASMDLDMPAEAAPCYAMPGKGVEIPTEKTFQEKLFEIIDGRGLTGPQVYKGYITKALYSKIQCNRDYQPTKSTALLLSLSLKLSLDETRDLLERAGLALSPSRKADVIVAGCIENGEFDVININSILFDYDCQLLKQA